MPFERLDWGLTVKKNLIKSFYLFFLLGLVVVEVAVV
jgi:hypothetical protein